MRLTTLAILLATAMSARAAEEVSLYDQTCNGSQQGFLCVDLRSGTTDDLRLNALPKGEDAIISEHKTSLALFCDVADGGDPHPYQLRRQNDNLVLIIMGLNKNSCCKYSLPNDPNEHVQCPQDPHVVV
ncbi:hypothetical protein BCV70DRAFT_204638 [Testicularia cyperi]|uniref:Uncharacterized protein n=1 Tax=Testicularia cyperi TaxID=1882483 RepID=A0A317XUB4_9BASI|nr:hypothetical protein BCV70DRAFT_204638 [Testicularia cyperi]